MRGRESKQQPVFSYVSLEDRVPSDHPLRRVRQIVDEILGEMAGRFDAVYAQSGRPSIPPERLLRALLLQIFFSVRSERLLMQQLDYNLLFRWFAGLDIDEPVWNHAVFSKNRERLLNEAIAREFFTRVLAKAKPHLSEEHFTVDGTLIEAWASHKSFQPKDGSENDVADFHGQQRRNDTHQSRTDPDSRLYRKGGGQEARLSYLGHVMVENRNGLIVDAMATTADGTAEADAALLMAWKLRKRRPSGRITLGADKAYDQRGLVRTLRELGVTAHVSQNTSGRRSVLDRRTTRHESYAMSQRKRPLIEKVFGWLKPVAGLRKVKLRGLEKIQWLVKYAAAAYNLWRMPRLPQTA